MNPTLRVLVLFSAIAFMHGPPAVAAEPLADLDAVRVHSEAAMTMIGKGRVADGIRRLASAWPLPEAEIERLIEQSAGQAPTMARRFGNVLGHESIAEQQVGSSFVRLAFLQRFERHAVVWRIVYYRADDGWYVNNLSYSDELEDVFESFGVRRDEVDSAR